MGPTSNRSGKPAKRTGLVYGGTLAGALIFLLVAWLLRLGIVSHYRAEWPAWVSLVAFGIAVVGGAITGAVGWRGLARREWRTFLTAAAVIGASGVILVVAYDLNPKGRRRVDAHYAALRVDLSSLARAQADFFRERGYFSTSLDTLVFVLSDGVRISVIRADSTVWEAVATHVRLPTTRCTYGDSAPPKEPPSPAYLNEEHCADPP